MIKFFHLIFILLSISSFVGRVYLAEKRPEMLEQKWIKIGPHIINSLLLLTGLPWFFKVPGCQANTAGLSLNSSLCWDMSAWALWRSRVRANCAGKLLRAL
jgi:uncharacterized membrane protein SirB2